MASESITTAIPRWRSDPGRAVLLWLIPAAGYYALLLSAGGSSLFAAVPNGLTFNSMLLHMLHGRFDVDPTSIGVEGYLRDGAVYAYFGVFPALFRALFLWLPGFAATDFTRVGCLAAVTAMALFKLRAVREVCRHAGVEPRSTLPILLIAAILASGPQIQFLRPSIYQEVELWSGAMAAAFVLLVLRGLLRDEGFTPRLLAGMAAAAGLCLLTRVSTALGLYVATGLVWLGAAGHAAKTDRPEPILARLRPWAMPLLILGGFVAATGFINLMRWGNPLVFADFTKSLILPLYPDRLARLQHYGEFNLNRLGYGLGYYFLPLWAVRDGGGQLIWSGFESGFTQCCVELPPSSFFVSDPLLIGLAGVGVFLTWRRRVPRRGMTLAAAAGLLVPILLMLTAFGMTFRYRMEFYPFFELFAFLGFARLLAVPGRGPRMFVGTATFAGIVAAHATWLLYMLSPFGPAGPLLGALPVGEFYRSLFH
jgi:hypothetical protein